MLSNPTAAFALLLIITSPNACRAPAQSRAPAKSPAATPVVAVEKLPLGVFIMDGTHVRDVLRQCSRGGPKAGMATWQPTSADVAMVEAQLAGALSTAYPARPGDIDFAKAPQGWWRQYVGIVRGGKRYVYGNFFRPENDPPIGIKVDWRKVAAVICDGGPQFFGVEFDVQTKKFTQIDFNGHV
jgi:hypothetical protein